MSNKTKIFKDPTEKTIYDLQVKELHRMSMHLESILGYEKIDMRKLIRWFRDWFPIINHVGLDSINNPQFILRRRGFYPNENCGLSFAALKDDLTYSVWIVGQIMDYIDKCELPPLDEAKMMCNHFLKKTEEIDVFRTDRAFTPVVR